MKRIRLLLLALAVAAGASGFGAVASGRLEQVEHFRSQFVDERTVSVWLPDGFSPAKKYAVLYMHDGQMLFDAAATWNHQEWGVDETMGALLATARIRDCIVVGVANIAAKRHAEYFPQRVFEAIAAPARERLTAQQLHGEPLADRYLKFLVTELKPYIDAHYPTVAGPGGTFVMGSSMGGLISLYAICEYPGVFGGAACLSTHTPLASFELIDEHTDADIASQLRDYLREHLPAPGSHRIYFDYGTGELDRYYPPYQQKVDDVMRAKGYTAANWVTREFPGEPHSEVAWSKRLKIPLLFLLGREEARP